MRASGQQQSCTSRRNTSARQRLTFSFSSSALLLFRRCLVCLLSMSCWRRLRSWDVAIRQDTRHTHHTTHPCTQKIRLSDGHTQSQSNTHTHTHSHTPSHTHSHTPSHTHSQPHTQPATHAATHPVTHPVTQPVTQSPTQRTLR
jgi:hypothetical protein